MARVKSEYEIEDIYIDNLVKLGYEYVTINNYSEFCCNFRTQFCKLNQEVLIKAKGVPELSDDEFNRIMLRLENRTIYESAKILREKWVLELDDGNKIYVVFFTDDTRNIFQVTHQVTMDPEHRGDVLYKNRYDVTILINGLPLVQTELKRPGVEINEAVNQINRYRRFSFKGLFRYIQIFIVSNSSMTKYFANANENDQFGNKQDILKSNTFFWTDKENKRINKLLEFTNSFLTKSAITELLSKYFVLKQSEPTLLVLRPYQIYAVKEAYERILNSGSNGYIFHTTGSGKTLTSFKLATLLRDDRRIERVFFLIDRNDLDDQTVDEYNSFEVNCVDQTENTSSLIKNLKDSTKTLIITTIQKMANALRKSKYRDVMELNRDKRCVFIIDECHRSQFGKMNAQIKNHFVNANYIGFTGTPIFKENSGVNGKTTADIFSSVGVNACIHRYMIKEAIADGSVLKFSVEYMRLVSVHDILAVGLNPDTYDDTEFCIKAGIDKDSFFHNQDRIEIIARNVVDSLAKHTRLENGDIYSAIFATDQIETLMKYYHYMKVHNSENYRIAAIFTYQPNQDLNNGTDANYVEYLKECIDDYNGIFGTDYDVSKFEAYRKDISRRMKQKELPQVDLLLVVDMFLTGFDSKATNTLFLDKNLVWHSLVQAYSRTNRVYKPTKKFGQIVTYRTIKKAQDDALRLFSGDGDPNGYLLDTYDHYVENYFSQVAKLREIVSTTDDAGDLQSEDDIKAFVLAFRPIVGTLSTLKTFSSFTWDDIAPALDEDEFSDFKSWYLYYYERSTKGISSTLVDIDFDIDLIRTDKINVVYILNLLSDINRNNISEMNNSIDLILREIERSDNERLRNKSEVMKKFITESFYNLDPNADIIESYHEYEKKVLQSEIRSFSEKNNLSEDYVSQILQRYFFDPKSITKEFLRNGLAHNGVKGLLQITSLVDKFISFLADCYSVYAIEE